MTTTTISKTTLSAVHKRAARNGVLVWKHDGWLYPDGYTTDATLPHIPEDRTLISGLEGVIRLGAVSDNAYSMSGVGIKDGYACVTDRYRAYSQNAPCLDGKDVYLSVSMCKTLTALLDTPVWRDNTAYAWTVDGQTYVLVGTVLLNDTSMRSAEYVVSTVRKLFTNRNDYRETEVSFPEYDAPPYQAAYVEGTGWVALPNPYEYEDVRRAYLSEHTPTVVFDGTFASDAARFVTGKMWVHHDTPGVSAVYASNGAREAIVMPVRIA